MSFPTLNIGDLIAKTPIVQGGMGVGISLSRLASAVANEAIPLKPTSAPSAAKSKKPVKPRRASSA